MPKKTQSPKSKPSEPSGQSSSVDELVAVMATLRSPEGCPWDREQSHRSLCAYAIEEVYELVDAVESDDDGEMIDELGDLLLQVVFHCQIGAERGAFDFERVCRQLVEKLIRRHPHVFGDVDARTVDEVWKHWDRIKKAEKESGKNARRSALDGIPHHLPALLRVEKLVKKARKAKLLGESAGKQSRRKKADVASELFSLAEYAQQQGWSAEELLRSEIRKRDRQLRRVERQRLKKPKVELKEH